MTGAEYIAEFLAQRGVKNVYLLIGGATCFMVDAIHRHQRLNYICTQHEQAAAFATDAVWRVSGRIGVAMATSGPGATNLITGIACNWFDSIPAMYITGQVNMRDAAVFGGTKVRQIGFQETDIVSLVKPITKYAVQVRRVEDLKTVLTEAWNAAITGRMGPVLVDVPMDIQQAKIDDKVEYTPLAALPPATEKCNQLKADLESLFGGGSRPVVLFGGGVGLAGVQREICDWLKKTGIPCVASWHGADYIDHDISNYVGTIGVYGNRGANYVLQNCDTLLVLGSRLDTRQRPGDPKKFAPGARVHVVDLDEEELKKYTPQGWGTTLLDMRQAAEIVTGVSAPGMSRGWLDYISEMKARWFHKDSSTCAVRLGSISPHAAILRLNEIMDDDGIVAVDLGSVTCWFYQCFKRSNQIIFTNGGCAPIAYALPAAIGAAVERPEKMVACIIGDGGFQTNIQELQTVKHYGLNIVFILLNNRNYGIVKQFQDIYLEHRNSATVSAEGYSVPDFKKVVEAYGLRYFRIEDLRDLTRDKLEIKGGCVIEVVLHEDTIIEPKLELGRPINDQAPHVPDDEFNAANRFVKFDRPGGRRDNISD